LLLGLGGSATNDGGAGMAQALGAKLLDIRGNELPPGGEALLLLHHIDIAGLDPRLKSIEITVACDVDNVLCGPSGASFVYGPQKGASAEDARLLDNALDHYADVIKQDLARNVRDNPGAGAAGGLGAGLLAFTNARMKPGIELVLDTLHFDALLDDARLVITGEGYLDSQTLRGKAPLGVAQRAAKKNVACIAIGGDIDSNAQNALKQHFITLESLRAFAGSLERAKTEAKAMLESLAAQNASKWLERAEAAQR
jgi:glycerate 2-kinase